MQESMTAFVPRELKAGPLLTGYTRDELLRRMGDEQIVLPICSLGTPLERLTELGTLILPPLYHEALDSSFKGELLARIRECFPFFPGTQFGDGREIDFDIVEIPPETWDGPASPRVLAFSVDTAVEEHGPHLPLATDTIQSYAVLGHLAEEFPELVVGPPVDYGHLTWGLPFGVSIDITPQLVTSYVTAFANALLDWTHAQALYVVDVHGSIVHRQAIQQGLENSRCRSFAFRWLHEPLVEFAAERGDQHAGGVETALIEYIDPQLTDAHWWPGRIDELPAGQLSFASALELTPDLSRFIEHVMTQQLNGIVGDINNYHSLNAEELMQRMLNVARDDVQRLLH